MTLIRDGRLQESSAKVDTEGALLVEGLDSWINQLIYLSSEGPYLHFQDKETGAKYAIKRINYEC